MAEERADLAALARDTLECMEAVALSALRELDGPAPKSQEAFTSVNTLNDGGKINSLSRLTVEQAAGFQALTQEPLLARVVVLTETGEEQTIYISRLTTNIPGGRRMASYRSPIGHLASLDPGDDFRLPNGDEVEVVTNSRFRARRVDGSWDSLPTEHREAGERAKTIQSLRALLESRFDLDEEEIDLVEALLSGSAPEGVTYGLRREMIERMALRDQAILDPRQSETFRLPIDTRLFLTGPPGTGKTTTLIRRLGQKAEYAALGDEEKRLVGLSSLTPEQHSQSWIMFTPSELLRQYVKEAFVLERIPASDQHIRTWEQHRRTLARNVFGVLKDSAGKGSFTLGAPGILAAETVQNPTGWFDDFYGFLNASTASTLAERAGELASDADPEVAAVGGAITRAVADGGAGLSVSQLRDIAAMAEDIERIVKDLADKGDRRIRLALNSALKADRDFVAKFAAEIAQADQLSDASADEEADDDEDNVDQPEERGTVSTQRAVRTYLAAIRTLARDTVRGRRPSPRTRTGRLIAWLADRVPERSELEALGRELATQARLSAFRRPFSIVADRRRICSAYREFRTDRQTIGRWYEAMDFRNGEVGDPELDIILLAILKKGNEVISGLRGDEVSRYGTTGTLGQVAANWRNQVMVDEAPDFSAVQLAAMFELSNPSVRSFFICGDFNQRVTPGGARHIDDISWIDKSIGIAALSISYRQSSLLVDFAKRVAAIEQGEMPEINLPDREGLPGVMPALLEHAADTGVKSRWLAERIAEIETTAGRFPSIAVLVNSEAEVVPVAAALQDALASFNLRAVPCLNGQVGDDGDVRVFYVEHIKGLEFEAVFFVDIDRLAETSPDLFSKYLYVGATRAATYLGLTCADRLPAPLRPLADGFVPSW